MQAITLPDMEEINACECAHDVVEKCIWPAHQPSSGYYTIDEVFEIKQRMIAVIEHYTHEDIPLD